MAEVFEGGPGKKVVSDRIREENVATFLMNVPQIMETRMVVSD